MTQARATHLRLVPDRAHAAGRAPAAHPLPFGRAPVDGEAFGTHAESDIKLRGHLPPQAPDGRAASFGGGLARRSDRARWTPSAGKRTRRCARCRSSRPWRRCPTRMRRWPPKLALPARGLPPQGNPPRLPATRRSAPGWKTWRWIGLTPSAAAVSGSASTLANRGARRWPPGARMTSAAVRLDPSRCEALEIPMTRSRSRSRRGRRPDRGKRPLARRRRPRRAGHQLRCYARADG